jgi:hypothetical protein
VYWIDFHSCWNSKQCICNFHPAFVKRNSSNGWVEVQCWNYFILIFLGMTVFFEQKSNARTHQHTRMSWCPHLINLFYTIDEMYEIRSSWDMIWSSLPMAGTVETQGWYRVLHFSLSVSVGEEYQNCLVLETIWCFPEVWEPWRWELPLIVTFERFLSSSKVGSVFPKK